jgi:UDP-N-acetylmuramoyl-tripeptide--D-alanyl-D-alanine ligase
VFPFGDAFTPLWNEIAHEGATRRCLTFGDHPDADIGLARAEWREGAWTIEVRTPLGAMQTTLHIAGHHNVINALAATACALASGVSLEKIAEGLAAFEPVKGRSKATTVALPDGRALTLVDDTYNANPDSVRAAIDVLAALPGPRLLVLGDMGEVGDQAEGFHAEVGAWARERGVEMLFALGDATVHSVASFADERVRRQGRHFTEVDALNAAVLEQLPALASVLVKGSRFMRMERVVQAIAASTATSDNHNKEAGHAA